MASLSEKARISVSTIDFVPAEIDDMSGICRGEMRLDEPMSRHTSWRTGGCAQHYYVPVDLEDFASCLRELQHEPIYVIGLGSNLLIRDGGIQGTVIALHAQLNELRLIEQNQSGGLIYADAGVACAKVARFAAKHNLAGAEFLAGIPGTIGGALAMNAGCYGSETWEFIEQVQVVNRKGQVFIRTADEYAIGYRSVKLQPETSNVNEMEWFAGGYIRLAQGEHTESRQRIKQLLAQRAASQPLNQPNAGSVFRNPPGDHAARLIEISGLKGCSIGGALVSPQHANFIVNQGHANATDIEALILMVQSRVKKATGVDLIQEVRIIGDVRRLT
ncbi:UDP-N-acetylmuramate dehydrogenase [Nitrosomonas supralitoralis]|uniref:UDP-N-acetylenolpyruvoylglucosamine reductase n=1 Tax=Nitrosomonas supralitoralis TaxID=2116706 RepID=A0A2P7NSF5_9PROT|nr:UDP-N-acetylmuramate dehydrogenase [Nitrosomonas supralitoralis]PSJ16396.1 UDP-N-acetylenolpyruvoylglucosamine reductase [Nitrosomonas supralitoralis]